MRTAWCVILSVCALIVATQGSDVVSGADDDPSAPASSRKQWGGKPSGTVLNALQNVGTYAVPMLQYTEPVLMSIGAYMRAYSREFI